MTKNSPKIASNGSKWSWNDLIILKFTSETISIGFLLLLQSFWVVTRLVCNEFDFRVKNGPEMTPKWPQNCLKWPQCLQSDFRNHLHQNSAPLAVVLSGHMTSLRQFWVLGHKLAQNGPEMAPKWPRNCPKWPQWVQSDFRNHLHRISAPFAVVLSCHMTSLRQIWIRVQKWPQIAPKWPKMA